MEVWKEEKKKERAEGMEATDKLLNVTLALVALGRDTADGVGVLALEVFVRSLLPLLAEGSRLLLT